MKTNVLRKILKSHHHSIGTRLDCREPNLSNGDRGASVGDRCLSKLRRRHLQKHGSETNLQRRRLCLPPLRRRRAAKATTRLHQRDAAGRACCRAAFPDGHSTSNKWSRAHCGRGGGAAAAMNGGGGARAEAAWRETRPMGLHHILAWANNGLGLARPCAGARSCTPKIHHCELLDQTFKVVASKCMHGDNQRGTLNYKSLFW